MTNKNFVNECSVVNGDVNKQLNLAWEDFSKADYCRGKCEFYDTCLGDREACLKKNFANLLATFSETEQAILKMRFGFCDNKLFSQNEIAEYLNLPPERVRQITARALRKLRHPARCNRFLKRKNAYCSTKNEFFKNLITEALG